MATATLTQIGMNRVAPSSSAAIQLQQVGVGLLASNCGVLADAPDRLGRQIHVVADVLHRLRGQPAERAVLLDLGPDVARQLAERRHDGRVDWCVRKIVADDAARARATVRRAVCRDRASARVGRCREERLDGAVRHRAVERVGGRHHADQDQHDQPHAFLAVVRAVREADARARQDQDAANPQRRRRGALRLAVESGLLATSLRTRSSSAAAQKPMSGESSSE